MRDHFLWYLTPYWFLLFINHFFFLFADAFCKILSNWRGMPMDNQHFIPFWNLQLTDSMKDLFRYCMIYKLSFTCRKYCLPIWQLRQLQWEKSLDCSTFGLLFEFCSASLHGKIQNRAQMSCSQSVFSHWSYFTVKQLNLKRKNKPSWTKSHALMQTVIDCTMAMGTKMSVNPKLWIQRMWTPERTNHVFKWSKKKAEFIFFLFQYQYIFKVAW